MRDVNTIINYYAQKVTGSLGIGYKNFKTGEEYYVNGDKRFPSASTFKVPLLIELFHQVTEGKLALTDMITLKEEDISPGSGVLSVLTPGLTMSVRDYAMLMMIVSDNTGTDLTFRLLGADNIKAMIDAMGLKNTRSDLTCRDLIFQCMGIPLDYTNEQAQALFESGKFERDDTLYRNFDVPNDFSSPRDMVTMFSLIYEDKILTSEACRQMRDMMKACQTNSRIPYHLPHDGTVDVIHKTGTLDDVFNDCGIVVTPTQTYALTMFYNRIDATQAEKDTPHMGDYLLADISREIYEALHP